MKMRIHAYDHSHDTVTYDVSIGGAGFGIVVDISEEKYKGFEEIIEEYNDVQETLEKLYRDELNRQHGL